MALILRTAGREPTGTYDGLDTEYLTLKGGEIVTFTSVPTPSQPGITTPGFDKAAADSLEDGYVNPSGVAKRPVITRNVGTTKRPLFLSDDGLQNYGTLFGTVVGGVVGQVSFGPNSVVPSSALLGPHTATGSGKVTCWDKPGIYAVTLDAVDGAADGLVPSNTAIDTGTSLTWVPASTTGGQLTPVGSTAAAGNSVVVGRFIEFETNNALVTTPNTLVAALNSPSGIVSSVGTRQMFMATFYFSPPVS